MALDMIPPPRIAIFVEIDLALKRAVGAGRPEITVLGIVADRLAVIRIERNCRDAIGDKLGKFRGITSLRQAKSSKANRSRLA